MTKKGLRTAIRSQLKVMDSGERIRLGALVCRNILSSREWSRYTSLYVFNPLPREPDISPLALSALATGRPVGVAVVGNEGLFFRRIGDWNGPGWTTNRFGIPEPAEGPVMEPHTKAGPESGPLILVPGLLFAKTGERLGRGGGYYDRWLTRYGNHCRSIGICFSFQVTTGIPVESHDCRMDALCTDEDFTLIKF